MAIFNTNPVKRTDKLLKKSESITSPFSKMLLEAQVHNSNLELFEAQLDTEILELMEQKAKVGKDKAKNYQLIDKLNRLFDVVESVE